MKPYIAITEPLSNFVASLRHEDLPPECVSRAKCLILDLAGSILRASSEAGSTECLRLALSTMGMDGDGPATILGWQRLVAPPVAALANGMLGHSLEVRNSLAGGLQAIGA